MAVNRLKRGLSVAALSLTALLSAGAEPLSAQLEAIGPDFGAAAQSLVAIQAGLADIYDNNNRKVGEVQNLFVNPQTGAIEQVVIQFDLDPSDRARLFLVPWNQFSTTRRNNGALALVLDQTIIDRVRRPASIAPSSATQQLNERSFFSGGVTASENGATTSGSLFAPGFGRQ